MIIDIWILHGKKEVFISDIGGIPAELLGYVSDEAKATAEQRGYPTVSEIGFPADCHLTAPDWGEAMELARAKAGELGFILNALDSLDLAESDEEEYWGEVEDNYGYDRDDDWNDGYPD